MVKERGVKIGLTLSGLYAAYHIYVCCLAAGREIMNTDYQFIQQVLATTLLLLLLLLQLLLLLLLSNMKRGDSYPTHEIHHVLQYSSPPLVVVVVITIAVNANADDAAGTDMALSNRWPSFIN